MSTESLTISDSCHPLSDSGILQSLSYLDTYSGLEMSTLKGRQEYAEQTGIIFRYLQTCYADNRPVWLELSGILEDLEKWKTYQAPLPKRAVPGKITCNLTRKRTED